MQKPTPSTVDGGNFNVFTYYTPFVHGTRREVIDVERDARPVSPSSVIFVEKVEGCIASASEETQVAVSSLRKVKKQEKVECMDTIQPDVIVLSDSDDEMNSESIEDEIICVGEVKAVQVKTEEREGQKTPKKKKKRKSSVPATHPLAVTFPSKSKKRHSITSQEAMVMAEIEYGISRGDIAMSLYKVLRSEASIVDMLSINTLKLCGQQARFFDMVQEPPGENYQPLRVCSYNVLCQHTTKGTKYLYGHLKNDPSSLSWCNRWKLLSMEIPLINADIFGMQEVEHGYLSTHYMKLLERDYDCRFKRRLNPELNHDGCMIAVKKGRILIEEYEDIEYFMGQDTCMNKPQVGQVAVLFDLQSNQRIIFANTHLLFNENRGDIKLGQLSVLFAYIHKLQKGRDLPVFVTGDFNMQPFCPLYKFITESSLSLGGLSRNSLSGQGGSGGPIVNYPILPPYCNIGRDSTFGGANRTNSPDLWTHPFNFASAYSHVNTDGKKEVSTFHRGVANPDFIFYSINDKSVTNKRVKIHESPVVKLVCRLGLPDEEFLRGTLREWPNIGVPSDHIPLVADFSVLKRE